MYSHILFILFSLLTTQIKATQFSEQRPLLRNLLENTNTSSCCSQLQAIGFSSTLPVVIIDSHGEYIPHHTEKRISLCTCSNGAPFEDYQGLAMGKGRGTSSANFTKKSFQLNLISDKNESKAEIFPFLGMPKESDFILSGPEVDKTIGIRNYLTYNLAIASGHYASRTVYHEVFLIEDGAPLSMKHYNGLYIGAEKVKRDKNRVDIQKLKAPDFSGGYIFLYDNDNINQGDVTFGPLKGWDHPFILKEPKQLPSGNPTWLLNYLTDFETALYADDWLQRTGNASYRSFVDMRALQDFFLLVELTKSPDGYRGSTFMHKDVGKPFVPGPVWDYDEAYGQCCGYPLDGWQRGGQSGPGTSGGSAISPEGWRFNICADPGRCIVEPRDGTAVWYRRMWEDPQYRTDVATRWGELRQGVWSDAAVQGMIDDVAARMHDAAKRNYEKYYDVLVDVEKKGQDGVVVWQGEVDQMKQWLQKHLQWMDGQFASIPVHGDGGGGVASATVKRSDGGNNGR